MCSPKEYVFQETKKFVSVIWQQFHGLCEHKNSHLEGKVQYSFVVIAKIDVLLCTVGLSAQEEHNDDCRRIKVTRCAMPNQHIFKLDVPE